MPDTQKQRGRPKDEQLAARRTEEILDAAARVFAERGYRNTDVQVVADELGLGKGTIYRYFPSKRDLFLAAADRGMQRLLADISAIPTDLDPLEQIAGGIRAYLAFYDAHPEFVELQIQERAEFKDRHKPTYFEYHDCASERWNVLLQKLMTEGRMRATSVEAVMDVVGALLYGTMFTNYFAGRQKPLEQEVREIIDLVFRGILTPAEQVRRAAMDT